MSELRYAAAVFLFVGGAVIVWEFIEAAIQDARARRLKRANRDATARQEIEKKESRAKYVMWEKRRREWELDFYGVAK